MNLKILYIILNQFKWEKVFNKHFSRQACTCIFDACCTLTYSGSLRLSTRRVALSSHTGLRFLWMVLLLNTSFPAILNLTYGSLVPGRENKHASEKDMISSVHQKCESLKSMNQNKYFVLICYIFFCMLLMK